MNIINQVRSAQVKKIFSTLWGYGESIPFRVPFQKSVVSAIEGENPPLVDDPYIS
jgi:hypothetical protein